MPLQRALQKGRNALLGAKMLGWPQLGHGTVRSAGVEDTFFFMTRPRRVMKSAPLERSE